MSFSMMCLLSTEGTPKRAFQSRDLWRSFRVIGSACRILAQQPRSVDEYYLHAKDSRGLLLRKLDSILGDLINLLPWLRQWHNNADPDLRRGLGDYDTEFVDDQCRTLGLMQAAGFVGEIEVVIS